MLQNLAMAAVLNSDDSGVGCIGTCHKIPQLLFFFPHYHSAEMQKVADAADISVLFFSAGANFCAILGHFWAILVEIVKFGRNCEIWSKL